MAEVFTSLLLIVAVAFVAPLISWTIPKRLVPEVVLLILGGMLIGPHGLGLAVEDSSIELLRELGVAFLFLMAGYEIDVNELRGSGGRHAMAAWAGSLTLAFAAVGVVGVSGGAFSANGIAIAIAMTSTAIGTILPILRERGLLPTAVGAAILNHGAVGEVGPVILMALLLGSRSAGASLAILLLFSAVTFLIVRFTDRVRRAGRRLTEAIRLGGSTTAQTTVRVTVLLLVGLCTLAEVFDLDVVLGAFAAGFILRYALPDGNREFEEKLDGLAYGFFIPIFFVVSGMGIELTVSKRSLATIGAFLLLLVLVRGLPVWASARLERRRNGSPAYSMRQSLQIAVYSTTALPIIVAVTQVAVSADAMTDSFASTLVLAGAVSVLVMPTLGLLLSSRVDHAPAVEALAVVQGPREAHGHGLIEASGDAAGATSAGEMLTSEPRRPARPSSSSADDAGSEEEAAASGVAPGSGTAARTAGPADPEETAGPPTPSHGLRRRGRDLAFHHRGLSETESRWLAERLARIEAERAHWRQQMRHQLTIEREEARQRRAVLWAQDRAQRRREREQLRELHEEARRRSGAGGGQGGEPD